MDLRVKQIMDEFKVNDNSFMEKDTLLQMMFGGTKFTKQEMRDAWHGGVSYGIELGLRKASLEGQRIELTQNTTNPRHKEFIEKFYKLAQDYECAIQYHPEHGMVIVSRK